MLVSPNKLRVGNLVKLKLDAIERCARSDEMKYDKRGFLLTETIATIVSVNNEAPGWWVTNQWIIQTIEQGQIVITARTDIKIFVIA